MVLAASNKSKQLLHMSCIGQVGPEELARGLEDLKMLLAEFAAGLSPAGGFGPVGVHESRLYAGARPGHGND